MKYEGIEEVVEESKDLRGYNHPLYLEVFYDTEEDEVWAYSWYNLEHSWHIEYNEENIIKVATLSYPITLDGLRQEIKYALILKEMGKELK